jgi:ABC-type uncharacterized transport system permease subunit
MNWERFGIKIEKQLHTTPLISFSIPLLAILLALLIEGVFLFISGYNPFEVYGVLFKGAFGTWYGLSESIVTAIPLILTGLGVSIAFRCKFGHVAVIADAVNSLFLCCLEWAW